MKEIAALEEKREQILHEIRDIRSMRKGSVTEQYLRIPHKGIKEPAVRGPYWVYTRKEHGKTVAKRLNHTEADIVREEVEAYHRFQSLCREYAETTEKLSVLGQTRGAAIDKKKRQRSPLKGIQK